MIDTRTPAELLATTLTDLDLVDRLARERDPGGPEGTRCSLAGWMSPSSGRTDDATGAQVQGLWSLLTDAHAGDRARADFVHHLGSLRLEGEGDDLDVTRARAAEKRLVAATGLRRRVLDTLRDYCRPNTTWETAAGLVADACAPPEVRRLWSGFFEAPVKGGRAGRPRRDPSAPPPEVVRLEWGGGLLENVVRWWNGLDL